MKLSHVQLDALRELGNIGAAHAATTLSMMLASNIEMEVPQISLLDISKVHTQVGDELSALVLFQVNGEVTNGGYVILHMPKQSAIRLTNVLTGLTGEDRELNEMDNSALLEIGNIMISAFLDATATLLNIIMLPSPPTLLIDMPHAAIETILSSQESDINEVVLFRTESKSDTNNINSNILLLPNQPMLDDILRMLETLVTPA